MLPRRWWVGLYLVVMMTIIQPISSQDLPAVNPDNLDPKAAHVCQSTVNETYSQLESYTQYYTQKTVTWCISFIPRCTEYRIAARVAYRIATMLRSRKSYFCCSGYQPQPQLNYCIPKCQYDCYRSQSHGFCVTPGNCLCHDGFQGQYCESSCPQGTWGKDCSKSCQCSEHGSCDPENGNCICSIGYTGSTCSQPCQGSFGLHCVNPCVCENNATCNNINGRCTCQTGYYGAYCHKKCDSSTVGEASCPETCPCQHGTCTATGGCTCLPGYKGDYCAEPCSLSEWGPGCQKTCTCYSGHCNSSTGECICQMGFEGDNCESQCPPGYYGNGCATKCACQNGGICYYDDKRNVQCDCTNTGYHGLQCSQRDCPYNKYNVAGTCVGCLCQWNQTESCHPHTGLCQCLPGYKGLKCETKCSMPFYGRDCSQVCQCAHGDCHPATGACQTCYPGYQGERCDQPCVSGKWGEGCLNDCACLNNADCHVTTGYCNCTAGFQGMLCGTPCSADRYGRNCANMCTCNLLISTCNPYTGSCQCKAGYSGNGCVSQCQPGWYGYNCVNRCSCYSYGTQSCDPATGECTCKAGWKGVSCNSKCPDTLWGLNCQQSCECNHHGSCDQDTGACQCYPGYKGNKCEEMCDPGYFGLNCTSQCPTCVGLSTCNYRTGECTSDSCLPGFTGPNCQTLCPHGYWGKDCANKCAWTCVQNGRCHPITGSCQCYPGFVGSNCDSECREGMFGVGCDNVCPCVENNYRSCDKRNGRCQCKNGYTGNYCEQGCLPGTWGPDCRMQCSDVCHKSQSQGCHPQSGLPCDCKPGFEGPTCADVTGASVVDQQTGALATQTSPALMPIIIAVSVALIVLVVIIVLLVCHFGRRVQRLKEENMRVEYFANGHSPEQTMTDNGHVGGLSNPVYTAQNLNNDRRYPHLSQRGNPRTQTQRNPIAIPVPEPNNVTKESFTEDDDFDDIAEEKLRVCTEGVGNCNKAYAVEEEDEERYTTLKSMSNPAGTQEGAASDLNIHASNISTSKVADKQMVFTGPKVPNDERPQPSSGATKSQDPLAYINNTYGH